MKKKILTRMILATLLVATLLTAAGCSEDEEEAPLISPIKITLTIDFPEKSGREDVDGLRFKLEEDSSALEAIQLYCKVNDIPMLVETTEEILVGIDGINDEADEKKGSWKFTVNGKTTRTPENETILETGDTLAWYYAE